jgi:hypothetical protein
LSLRLIGLLPCLVSAKPKTFGAAEKSHRRSRINDRFGRSTDKERRNAPAIGGERCLHDIFPLVSQGALLAER